MVRKRIFRFPQEGFLADELFEQQLNKHRYNQSIAVPGLWKHESRHISFTLIVDDFGVKCVGKEHSEHQLVY